MRVFVTGHRGYIGVVLTRLLEEAGHEVFGCDTDLYERCSFAPGGRVPDVPGDAQGHPRPRGRGPARLRRGRAPGRRCRTTRSATSTPRSPTPSTSAPRCGWRASPSGPGSAASSSPPPARPTARAGDDFIDETGEIQAGDALRRVEGAGRARHRRARRRRLLPDLPALGDRLRRLAAHPLRPRAQQPRRLGRDDRADPDEVRRHAVAADRPHRGHLPGVPRRRWSAEPAAVLERGVQRRHHRAELPHPRARRHRGARWCPTAGSTSPRAPGPTRAATASTARRSAGCCPASRRSGTPRRARGSSTRPICARQPDARGVRGPALPAHRPRSQADRRRRDRREPPAHRLRRQAEWRRKAPPRSLPPTASRPPARMPAAIPAGAVGLLPVLDLGHDAEVGRAGEARTSVAARAALSAAARPTARTARWCSCSRRRRRKSCSAPTTSTSRPSRRRCSSTRAQNARGADRAARSRAGQPGGRAREQRRLPASELRPARHSGPRASNRRRSRREAARGRPACRRGPTSSRPRLRRGLRGEGWPPTSSSPTTSSRTSPTRTTSSPVSATILKDDGLAVVEFPYVRDLIEHRRVRHDLPRAPLLLLGRQRRRAVPPERALHLTTCGGCRSTAGRSGSTIGKTRGAVGGGRSRSSPRSGRSGSTATPSTRASPSGWPRLPRAGRGRSSAASRRTASASPPTAPRPRARSCSTTSDLNDRTIEYVVDKNIHKHGKYMPGRGPEGLRPGPADRRPAGLRGDPALELPPGDHRRAAAVPRRRWALHRADPEPGHRVMDDFALGGAAPRPVRRPSAAACPACGSGAVEPFYRVQSIPLHSCVLLDSPEAARAFPRRRSRARVLRRLRLRLQRDLRRARSMAYSTNFEESQHFSDTFNAFARGLAGEIAATLRRGRQAHRRDRLRQGRVPCPSSARSPARPASASTPAYRADPGRTAGAVAVAVHRRAFRSGAFRSARRHRRLPAHARAHRRRSAASSPRSGG